MLMLIILTWGRDLVMGPANSVQDVHDMKRRLDIPDADYIIYDSAFLCPVRFDRATRQLDEEEQIEWLMTEAFPQLEEEGRLVKRQGKYRRPLKLAIADQG